MEHRKKAQDTVRKIGKQRDIHCGGGRFPERQGDAEDEEETDCLAVLSDPADVLFYGTYDVELAGSAVP